MAKSVVFNQRKHQEYVDELIETTVDREDLEYQFEAVLEWAEVYEAVAGNETVVNVIEAVQEDWDDVDDLADALEMLARCYTGSY